MKTIEELIGTFEVGQKYQIELSTSDAWYDDLGKRFVGEVEEIVEFEKDSFRIPYFKVNGESGYNFSIYGNKAKLIEEK